MSDAGPRDHDDLFWRDEVMEAMYWMLGEGIEDAVEPADLRGFLEAPSDVLDRTFATLEEAGHLEAVEGCYVFTERGDREAARRFADEFADIQGFDEAHNDCGPDCWCHDPEHVEEACPADEHEHEHAD